MPLIILLIYPLKYIVNFVTFPYPLEYREAAMISPAIDFSKGINPYTIANYPDHIYLYGVLYPLMLTPIVNLFEHPILAVRIINAVFLVLFLGMSVWIFRKRNASYISILIGIIILLNSFCYIWFINGARPDIIGLFFAIAGYCILIERQSWKFASGYLCRIMHHKFLFQAIFSYFNNSNCIVSSSVCF